MPLKRSTEREFCWAYPRGSDTDIFRREVNSYKDLPQLITNPNEV
ncbi:MAG: hypothetical protein Ct9H90mP27_5180 [Gammaproteobacteria bacterium]|nr:MAG: hypothetical protein Ct9H90mP27_5180 [Gammaproteobacteria bacterium]